MSNDNNVRKFTLKPSLLVYRSQLAAACDENKIGLEDWDRHHNQTLQAELGRLGISSAKAGLMSIGKGCETAREGMSNSYKPGGKSAHASIRFYRECLAVTGFVDEFPSCKVGMSDESVTYVKATAQRVAELASAKKSAGKPEPANA